MERRFQFANLPSNIISTWCISFDDVSAWVDYIDNSTEVDLIFKIKELPALDTAVLDGNDEISEDDLRLKMRLIPGQVYSKSQLERDRQAMIDYYHSEGFLLAEVGYRETPVDDNKNMVTFIIREGEKVKVRDIKITGNDNVPAIDITDHMLTKVDQRRNFCKVLFVKKSFVIISN